MEPANEFYLLGDGPHEGEPWKCRTLGHLSWRGHRGLLWVEITPPIASHVYHTPLEKGPLTELVLLIWKDRSFFLQRREQWPKAAHILTIVNDDFKRNGRARDDDLRHVDRGVLYRTEEDARKNILTNW